MVDFAQSCKEILSVFSAEQDWKVRRIVSVSENGKTYILRLNPPKECAVYQIDGHIITSNLRCDKLIIVISDVRDATIFVELKGRDVEHAIKQLESTLSHPIFKQDRNPTDIIRARIVSNSGPASPANKALNLAKIQFLKRFNCDLRLIRSKSPDVAL